VSMIGPVFCAKQMVTADHIGQGRFGLNIVSGWNVDEHAMHGIQIRDHDARYEYSEEWVNIVKRIWSETEPFDHHGKFFNLKNVKCKPRPYGDGRPFLVSAGNSPVGRSFAARHCDCLFTSIRELDELADKIKDLGKTAPKNGAGIYASGHVIAKPTEKEAKEFYHYIVYEKGDWEAAEHTIKIRTKGGSSSGPKLAKMKEAIISGTGTYPIVGSYDEVAKKFEFLAGCGLSGMAIGLVNYVDDMPVIRDEILPRMQRLGLRQ